MVDFEKEFEQFNVNGQTSSDAIMSLYKIIPALSPEQQKTYFTLSYYAKKYDLDDLTEFLNTYNTYSQKNKNLGFFSSKQLRDLLKAYTQDELIRGIKVQSQKVEGSD